MPVEKRTADPALWARRAVQNHAPLPLVRFETPWERRRRRRRAALQILLLAALLWVAFLTLERMV